MESVIHEETVITLQVTTEELKGILSGGILTSLLTGVEGVRIRLYCTDVVSEEEHINPICY